MAYKIGGGEKLELYDPDNGQYTEEQKSKFLEKEISNIVMRYIFGLDDTFDPRYPIYGFHTGEYCELYLKYRIKHRINKLDRSLPYEKIKYLLRKSIKDDKSHFFNIFGYYSNGDDEKLLFDEIMNGSDFAKMKFNKFNEWGIFVKVPTTIRSRKTNSKVKITTIWRYDESERFDFITAIPKIMED